MSTKSNFIAFTFATAFTASASAQVAAPKNPDVTKPTSDAPAKLTLATNAGWLAANGGNGAALGAGVRYAIGSYFAVGLDIGYGLLAMNDGSLQDRWWIIPTMAGVIPARIGNVRATFDIGAGFGFGTSSGYASGATFAAQPLTADWAYQLVPTVRAHAIAAFAVSRSLEIFARVDAAALVLPEGTDPSGTAGAWIMLALGTRFRLL